MSQLFEDLALPDVIIVDPEIGSRYHLNTLSKCPSGHPISHRGLKLNSKISAEKDYKKINSPEQVDFSPGS